MPGTNILIGILVIAWFIPAFFFTHRCFKENKAKEDKVRLFFDQLGFIIWPIILLIVGFVKVIKILRNKRVKNK